MINREELLSYLDEALVCKNYNDYAPNGLQIEGALNIQNLCTAVTASAEAIDEAIKQKADALLVHHGFFWRGEDPVITGVKRKRVAKLLEHNINLLAYHLPLDGHPQWGNNACLAALFGLENCSMHKMQNNPNLLWQGSFAQAKIAATFKIELEQKLKRLPLHVDAPDRSITKLAWCSGAAQDFIEEAYKLGADAYLSGEISERTYYQAKELGIHYFACGHHATERFGVQTLGEHLAQKFNLQHSFIDSLNPV